MKKTLLLFSLSMLWTAGAWAQLKEGLWEIKRKVEIKGCRNQCAPTTIRQSVTKK